MLDYRDASIQELVCGRGWSELPEFERIRAIYNYVRDEVLFGYNVDDGFILDKGYLKSLQATHPECRGAFCGYGVAVKDFQNPVIDFNRNDTYIQSEGITCDYGVYESPDDMLREHRQAMSAPKAFAYRRFGRRFMNRNVRKIRAGI